MFICPMEVLKYYILLQWRRLIRKMDVFGIHPTIGIFLCVSCVALILLGIHQYTTRPDLIIFCLSILIQAISMSKSSLKMLNGIFNKRQMRIVKLSANILISVIASPLLLFYDAYLLVAVSVLTGIALSFINIRSEYKLTIPTPFKKIPFEAAIGFRKTFWLIIVAYLILAKGVQVENFGLCVSSIIIIMGGQLFAFTQVEPEYYVWIFKKNPQRFLKIKSSYISFSTISLIMPAIILSTVLFPQYILVLTTITMFGLLFLIMYIHLKYLSFPEDMGPSSSIYIVLALLFPPLLIFIIPHLHKKASSQLEYLLK